jgi:hypothetical protein
VCFLLNHTYNTALQAVPLACLQGVTVDISELLRFPFWQPVDFKLSESSFPSESKEALGHIVGISEHCGHALTYKVLSSESDVIIYCSLLRPATPDDANMRACMSGGESPTHVGPLKDRSSMDNPHLPALPLMRSTQSHHLPLSSILKTLLDAPSLWKNRKTAMSS